jgi:glycosyltransferase involved in cell wall biosynthesis
MKILQVLFSGLGGHGSVAFSLIRGDSNRAHQHHLLFYGAEPLASGYAELCAELAIGHEVAYKRPGLDLGSWARVIAAVRRVGPDVVLLHSMSLVAPVAAYARASRRPVVAVDHLSNQVKQGRDWRFTAMALALANRTVFLTDDFAAEVKARLGPLYRTDAVNVIGNGIDVEAFAHGLKTRPRETNIVRVGMHGRFSRSKDYGTLVRAIALLRDRLPNPGRPEIHLSLAGDGETLEVTRQQVNELGLHDRVEFLGMLPERDIPAFLHSLDIYAQSSLGETMSTAVMQAMAAGLPVVGTDVPGLRDMVRADETGLLFPCGNETELVRALESLAHSPDDRRRMGANARRHAVANWSPERMFRAYEELLLKTLPVGGT